MWEALCQKTRILKILTNEILSPTAQYIVFWKSVDLNFFWVGCPPKGWPGGGCERCTPKRDRFEFEVEIEVEVKVEVEVDEHSGRAHNGNDPWPSGSWTLKNWTNLNIEQLWTLNKFEHWTNWTNLNIEQIEQSWTLNKLNKFDQLNMKTRGSLRPLTGSFSLGPSQFDPFPHSVFQAYAVLQKAWRCSR